jgi:hypothetical protein
MIGIPFSRELIERRSKIDEEPLFRTTRISKCQVAALVRLTGKFFLAHVASTKSERIRSERDLEAPADRSSPDVRGVKTMRQSFPRF